MKILCVLFLSLVFSNIFSQQFEISNSSYSKKIKKGYFIEMIVGDVGDENPNCCAFTQMYGYLDSVLKDSIYMKVENMSINRSQDNVSLSENYQWEKLHKIQAIPKDEILYLKIYKSKKSQKRSDAFAIVGGLLMVSGCITALNTFLVKDSSNKNTFLIAGGIQISTGVLLGLSTNPSKYHFKKVNDPYKFVE